MANSQQTNNHTQYTDADLSGFVKNGLMSLNEAAQYAWRRDNSRRSIERSEVNA